MLRIGPLNKHNETTCQTDSFDWSQANQDELEKNPIQNVQYFLRIILQPAIRAIKTATMQTQFCILSASPSKRTLLLSQSSSPQLDNVSLGLCTPHLKPFEQQHFVKEQQYSPAPSDPTGCLLRWQDNVSPSTAVSVKVFPRDGTSEARVREPHC